MKYQSLKSVMELEDVVHYPVEFLTLWIRLKIGATILHLCNLVPLKLCNSTRLQVNALHTNVIEATIFIDCSTGVTVFLPRTPFLILSDYHFQFKRPQFPVKVCFAMIKKQSARAVFKIGRIRFKELLFTSHGQLFVRCLFSCKLPW